MVNSKDDLKLQGKIIKRLNELNYPTPQPVSRDLIQHFKSDPIEIEKALDRLGNEEPLEYILEYALFNGDIFIVNKSTLIPREETEVLVNEAEKVSREFLDSNDKTLKVLDIGTGSGAIIVTLEKRLQPYKHQVKFYATDSSKNAIETARLNEQYQVNIEEPRILFSRTDIIRDLEVNPNDNYLICANLPYIPTKDYLETQPSVQEFEPRTALDGGEDGLDLYRRLWDQIQKKKIVKFTLIAELHESQPTLYPAEMNAAFPYELHHTLIKDQYDVQRFIISQPL